MADRRELLVGGKPISSLRVVDLKVELEKRSLPKSGSKKDLLERLRLVIGRVFDSKLFLAFSPPLALPPSIRFCCVFGYPSPLPSS